MRKGNSQGILDVCHPCSSKISWNRRPNEEFPTAPNQKRPIFVCYFESIFSKCTKCRHLTIDVFEGGVNIR